LDEILQWSFTDRSYILALAFYESCYIHPFWLYHHAVIGCFYFHVSKKLSLDPEGERAMESALFFCPCFAEFVLLLS
jgi:hypothetical protein